MRGYEIWNGDAGEDVYECNGYGYRNGIKENCEYYVGFQLVIEAVMASLSDQAVRGRTVPKM